MRSRTLRRDFPSLITVSTSSINPYGTGLAYELLEFGLTVQGLPAIYSSKPYTLATISHVFTFFGVDDATGAGVAEESMEEFIFIEENKTLESDFKGVPNEIV